MEILNNYRGETITMVFHGDSTYDLHGSDTDTSNNPTFVVYVYLDTLNIEYAKKSDVKVIESDVFADTTGDHDGYVHFIDGENEVHCILPYSVTKDMEEGYYTVEFRYGDNVRSVFKKNSAFNLVNAVSQLEELVDENDNQE